MKKIVISIKNHVMAIHIKNYFLLIQPPASWLEMRNEKKTATQPAREKRRAKANNKAF